MLCNGIHPEESSNIEIKPGPFYLKFSGMQHEALALLNGIVYGHEP